MSQQRDIKRKIDSVNKTRKITRAMQMIAAVKLHRYELRLRKFEPCFDSLSQVLSSFYHRSGMLKVPLFCENLDKKKELIVVFSAQKGLCGNYHSMLMKKIKSTINGRLTDFDFVVVGRKGSEGLVKLLKDDVPSAIVSQHPSEEKYWDDQQIERVVFQVVAMSLDYRRVWCLSTYYSSASRTSVCLDSIFPYVPSGDFSSLTNSERVEYICEETIDQVVQALSLRWVKQNFLKAFYHSLTSEESARMLAMDMATRNAGEAVGKLKLLYNKARQAIITRELLEIVGGAEALQQI